MSSDDLPERMRDAWHSAAKAAEALRSAILDLEERFRQQQIREKSGKSPAK